MKRELVIVTLMTAGLTMGATAAYAATWTKTTDGSLVRFNNDVLSNDERFRVEDTEPDGNAVYAEYSYNGGPLTKHIWSGGYGTFRNFDHQWPENDSVKFRSCEEINNWPNDCSSYEDGARS